MLKCNRHSIVHSRDASDGILKQSKWRNSSHCSMWNNTGIWDIGIRISIHRRVVASTIAWLISVLEPENRELMLRYACKMYYGHWDESLQNTKVELGSGLVLKIKLFRPEIGKVASILFKCFNIISLSFFMGVDLIFRDSNQ